MKTSVLVSGIAALYFVLSVAETTRHHNEEALNATSNDNISFATINMIDMLPGVNVIPERKDKTNLTANITPSEDFSYLKFDVSKYMESDDPNQAESNVLPGTSETDYSYLKFNVNEYIESDVVNTNEPEALPEATEADFSYLKFNVDTYMKSDSANTIESENLPEPSETDYSYLKFDVTKYHNSNSSSSADDIETIEK